MLFPSRHCMDFNFFCNRKDRKFAYTLSAHRLSIEFRSSAKIWLFALPKTDL